MKIDTVTFDFWNTIFDSSGGSERNSYRFDALRYETSKLGYNISNEKFGEVMAASWEYFNNIWKNDFRTPLAGETVSYFWNKFELPDDDIAIENVAEAFGDCVLAHPPKLISGVAEVIKSLHERNIKLGIVSDTGFSPGTVLRRLLHDNQILDYFEAFSFSNETGYSKPHPKAFLASLDKLGSKPQNSLHIGDIEETDILGALGIGMKTVRFAGDTTKYAEGHNLTDSMADFSISKWDEFFGVFERL